MIPVCRFPGCTSTYAGEHTWHVTSKRTLGEVVALDRDCDLGQANERAVVIALDAHSMTLVFPDRAPATRMVRTGADYRFLRSV